MKRKDLERLMRERRGIVEVAVTNTASTRRATRAYIIAVRATPARVDQWHSGRTREAKIGEGDGVAVAVADPRDAENGSWVPQVVTARRIRGLWEDELASRRRRTIADREESDVRHARTLRLRDLEKRMASLIGERSFNVVVEGVARSDRVSVELDTLERVVEVAERNIGGILADSADEARSIGERVGR